MDCLQAITSRRSVRKFRPQAVDEADLVRILQAGCLAPSAGNRQPWYFIVVRDAQVRRQLQAAALEQEVIGAAPVVVAVCADPELSAARYGERGRSLYCLLDCANATENMLLAAHALGYGACWVGAFQERAVAAVLGLPPGFRVVALVPLGRPAESPPMPPRRRLEDVVRWERWD